MMSFLKTLFPKSTFLNFCLIAFDEILNSSHLGDLLHFNQWLNSFQNRKTFQIMTSFRTPMRFQFFNDKLYFCPHIAEFLWQKNFRRYTLDLPLYNVNL